MRNLASLPITEAPHLVRLKKLAQLLPAEIDALKAAGDRTTAFAARREIIRAGTMLAGPQILVRGWAAQVRDFRDGRRQMLHLLLPGDMIFVLQEPGTEVVTTILSLTDTSIAPAPAAETFESGLGLAYAISADIERSCLLRQIARLGRLDAYERLADFFLEMVDRLRHAGLTNSDSFDLRLRRRCWPIALGSPACT